MKLSAILLIFVVMIACVSNVVAQAPIRDQIKTIDYNLEFDIFKCVSAAVDAYKTLKEAVDAVKAKDFNRVIAIVTQAAGLVDRLKSHCLK